MYKKHYWLIAVCVLFLGNGCEEPQKMDNGSAKEYSERAHACLKSIKDIGMSNNPKFRFDERKGVCVCNDEYCKGNSVCNKSSTCDNREECTKDYCIDKAYKSCVKENDSDDKGYFSDELPCQYGCDPDLSKCRECQNGDVRCIDKNDLGYLQTCVNGFWSNETQCSYGLKCNDNIMCKECESSKCKDGFITKCVAGKKMKEQECAFNAECNEDGVNCNECGGDITRCASSLTYKLCDNGKWSEKKCDSGKPSCIYDINNEKATCSEKCGENRIECFTEENGKSYTLECKDGEWSKNKVYCPDNGICNEANNGCVKCMGNTKKCENNIVKICEHNDWIDDTKTCSNGCYVVTEDQDFECRQCVPNTCNNGHMCNNDGTSAEPCQSGQCDGDNCASTGLPDDNPCNHIKSNEFYCPDGQNPQDACIGNKKYSLVTTNDCKKIETDIIGNYPITVGLQDSIEEGCYYIKDDSDKKVNFLVTKSGDNYQFTRCSGDCNNGNCDGSTVHDSICKNNQFMCLNNTLLCNTDSAKQAEVGKDAILPEGIDPNSHGCPANGSTYFCSVDTDKPKSLDKVCQCDSIMYSCANGIGYRCQSGLLTHASVCDSYCEDVVTSANFASDTSLCCPESKKCTNDNAYRCVSGKIEKCIDRCWSDELGGDTKNVILMDYKFIKTGDSGENKEIKFSSCGASGELTCYFLDYNCDSCTDSYPVNYPENSDYLITAAKAGTINNWFTSPQTDQCLRFLGCNGDLYIDSSKKIFIYEENGLNDASNQFDFIKNNSCFLIKKHKD